MKKMILAGIIIILVFLLLGSRASNQPDKWQEYRVKAGDTVSSIAVEITPNSEDYRDTMNYIINKNDIKNGLIYPGQRILVPMNEKK